MATVTMTVAVLAGAAETRVAIAMAKLSWSGSERAAVILSLRYSERAATRLDSERAVARLSLSDSEWATG